MFDKVFSIPLTPIYNAKLNLANKDTSCPRKLCGLN